MLLYRRQKLLLDLVQAAGGELAAAKNLKPDK